MGRPKPAAWLWLVVVAALLPACGACDAYDAVEQRLPSLPVSTLDGRPVDLAGSGQPTAVLFWLPHCGVCANNVPQFMEAVRATQDQDVRVVAVSMDPDLPSIRERSARLGLDVEQLVATGEVLGPSHVAAAPSAVFLDRHGVIRAAVNGPKDAAFYRRRLRQIQAVP